MNSVSSQQICVIGLVPFEHRRSDTEKEADAHLSSLQESGSEKDSVYTLAQLTFKNDCQNQTHETQKKLLPLHISNSVSSYHTIHARPLFLPAPWETQNSDGRKV